MKEMKAVKNSNTVVINSKSGGEKIVKQGYLVKGKKIYFNN